MVDSGAQHAERLCRTLEDHPRDGVLQTHPLRQRCAALPRPLRRWRFPPGPRRLSPASGASTDPNADGALLSPLDWVDNRLRAQVHQAPARRAYPATQHAAGRCQADARDSVNPPGTMELMTDDCPCAGSRGPFCAGTARGAAWPAIRACVMSDAQQAQASDRVHSCPTAGL
jgi:hypothetical protein